MTGHPVNQAEDHQPLAAQIFVEAQASQEVFNLDLRDPLIMEVHQEEVLEVLEDLEVQHLSAMINSVLHFKTTDLRRLAKTEDHLNILTKIAIHHRFGIKIVVDLEVLEGPEVLLVLEDVIFITEAPQEEVLEVRNGKIISVEKSTTQFHEISRNFC